MVPEVLYFVAYVCVLDEKIYDVSYFKMINLLKKENLSNDVLNELLKILGDDENKISLDVILSNLKTAKNEDKDTALALGCNA